MKSKHYLFIFKIKVTKNFSGLSKSGKMRASYDTIPFTTSSESSNYDSDGVRPLLPESEMEEQREEESRNLCREESIAPYEVILRITLSHVQPFYPHSTARVRLGN